MTKQEKSLEEVGNDFADRDERLPNEIASPRTHGFDEDAGEPKLLQLTELDSAGRLWNDA